MKRHLIPGDASIRALRPAAVGGAVDGAGKSVKRLSDGAGLYLLPFVKGVAHGWRFAYTRPGGGRNEISLGTYPDTGLALARRKAQEAREMVAQGVDPSEARKGAQAAAAVAREAKRREDKGLPAVGSFEAVAREWLKVKHEPNVVASHAERTRRRLEADAFPWIGARPLSAIEAPELLAVLRRAEARGAIETAHRLKDACGQVFRYGIATGACSRNPAADLRGALRPVLTRHHAAVIEPDRAGDLLRALADYQGQPVTRAALRLSALLFLRPGELRQLEWSWVDWDSALVRVPSDMMKRRKAEKANGAGHIVPLAPQAVATLRDLQALTGQGRYVFPALHTSKRPMSENTVNMALRRLGFDRDTMTAHGFRAMARTMAVERLGVAPEVVEAQLAHAVGDSLGRAYNRTQFIDQRRELMTKWADYLDRLRDGAQVIEPASKRA